MTALTSHPNFKRTNDVIICSYICVCKQVKSKHVKRIQTCEVEWTFNYSNDCHYSVNYTMQYGYSKHFDKANTLI